MSRQNSRRKTKTWRKNQKTKKEKKTRNEKKNQSRKPNHKMEKTKEKNGEPKRRMPCRKPQTGLAHGASLRE